MQYNHWYESPPLPTCILCATMRYLEILSGSFVGSWVVHTMIHCNIRLCTFLWYKHTLFHYQAASGVSTDSCTAGRTYRSLGVSRMAKFFLLIWVLVVMWCVILVCQMQDCPKSSFLLVNHFHSLDNFLLISATSFCHTYSLVERSEVLFTWTFNSNEFQVHRKTHFWCHCNSFLASAIAQSLDMLWVKCCV